MLNWKLYFNKAQCPSALVPWGPGVSNVQVYAKLKKLIFENVHSFFINFNTE